MVADEGHGERDDRRGGDAADQPQGGEHGERVGDAAAPAVAADRKQARVTTRYLP